jgi:NADH-quinone oxidoreductase subunit N
VLGLISLNLDYHALAPEIVLSTSLLLVLLADLFTADEQKWILGPVCALGFLAAFVPVITLAASTSHERSMISASYVVDDFALVLKGLFLAIGFVTVLLSLNYMDEGPYYKGEFWFLLQCSVLGMLVISSARDLLTLFLALELLSAPAYVMAGWRKPDVRSNEASLKYFLLGVLSTAVMLYGMSLIYGSTGRVLFSEIATALSPAGGLGDKPIVVIGVLFTFVGFAFKVSAAPFHFWAPDTYEGAPTPVTAFLSVGSKVAGFVGLFGLAFRAFISVPEIWAPLFWVLAVLTMTVGNLVALRQTNIVRMLAYSSIAQAGYVLAPFAVANRGAAAQSTAFSASVTYLLIYSVMNLGAFAAVIAVARFTRSGEIDSYRGMWRHSPGLFLAMTVFLFSLAGVPPLGGWFAKLAVFRAVILAHGATNYVLAAIMAVNSVVAFFYYAGVARQMAFQEPPEGLPATDTPPPLGAAIGLTALVTVGAGIYPQLLARLSEIGTLIRV